MYLVCLRDVLFRPNYRDTFATPYVVCVCVCVCMRVVYVVK
jgi:hypothetical protein